MSLRTVNPATGEEIATYEVQSDSEVQSRLDAAYKSYLSWRQIPIAERAEYFLRLANVLESRFADLAPLVTQEMGKPIEQAEGEIKKCAWVCEFYANKAAEFLADQEIKTDFKKSYVSFQPMGAIFGIMPWNFPFWQAFRFAVPTLMAGNTVLLKHAPNVTGTALKLEELFQGVGLDEGQFQLLKLDLEQVPQVIGHPGVQGVSLTGSTRAGQSVASLAGQNLKKTVLELGGSDPYLILDDADLNLAADCCVTSRLLNTGQSCIAAKRFIVTKKYAHNFTDLIKEKMSKKKLGNPMDRGMDLGPIAREDLRANLHGQVTRSIKAGAEALLGGELPVGKGFFYPPSLLVNVQPGSPAFDEELFGPVASVIVAQDENEAIMLANQTQYGLGAAVFSKDIERAEKIAREQLNAGSCFVNDFVRSDPRLPFGGVKASGYARELSSFGIHEFVNIKTVAVGNT